MCWGAEAADGDEAARLRDLALHDRDLSIVASEREAAHVDVGFEIDRGLVLASRAPPGLRLTASGYEHVRSRAELASADPLEHLTYGDLQSLAEMLEGWALGARIDDVRSARCAGRADGYRMLARIAGPLWRDPPQDELSFPAWPCR